MEIKTVTIIGLGALGILFGHQLSKKMPSGNLRILADKERIEKYKKTNIYCNGELCNFSYITPEVKMTPADLVLFTVKYSGLNAAIKAVQNQVGDNTVILSALNGISSEAIIGKAYGMDKILYCVAQGMDAVKEENSLTYQHMGQLVFGEGTSGITSEKMYCVAEFFQKHDIPFALDTQMLKRQWGKFMLNVGVNQAVTVYEGNYGDVQTKGTRRDTMIAAMKEVIALSEKEGIYLTEEDLSYWLDILASLNPVGKPSMRQDAEAKRKSEVELFAGTVLELGKKHGIATPVNKIFYEKIQEMEKSY